MSIPKEGSRDTGKGILISKYPDYCRSPNAIIPYTIVAHQLDDANTCTTVRQTKQRSHNMGSIITCCIGDEPGTGLGIKSNTIKSVCHPLEHSKTVRFEGKCAIRHRDVWHMNNRNTTGKLYFVENTDVEEPTEAAKHAARYAGEPPSEIISDANPDPIEPGQRYAQAAAVRPSYPTPARPFSPSPIAPPVAPMQPPANSNLPNIPGPPRPPIAGPILTNPSPPIGGSFFQSYQPLPGFGNPIWMTDLDGPLRQVEQLHGGWYPLSQPIDGRTLVRQEELERLYAKARFEREESRRAAPQLGLSENDVRVTGRPQQDPCLVKRYGSLRCPQGEQAHHIVPDYALRYGTREEGIAGIKRIDGLPSFRDGPAICLQGYASRAGDEHGIAHTADAFIAVAGQSGNPVGTAPISTIRNYSVAGAIAAKPQCAAQIIAGVAAVPSLNGSTLARTTIASPGVWPPR